jgi:outer membrane protein OmpA-like peptidoglycan-associated protein
LTNSPQDPASDRPNEGRTSPDIFNIEELRRLILGPERARIDALAERLDDPDIRAREVGQVLPEAIALRTSHDEKMAKALSPTVEKAIEASIHKNRKVLVDVLFPVMGPAIRKAVASTIHAMIQALDKTLEHSLSFRGLKWRVEAWRTKKPFGEIVLLHTLLYQIEQIFLIDRETSLVLQHVVSKDVKFQDPDLVSSMLSAIQDFVRDSFHLDKEENLETLQIGADRTIWVEQGSRALLAAVIRGTPPLEVRTTLREILETIHLRYGEALERFDGDVSAFEGVRPDLEAGLQSRYKPKQKKSFPLVWVILGAGLTALLVWAFFSIQGHRRWVRFLGRLKNEPGILVTSGEKRSGMYRVQGLRDPAAANPADLLPEEKLDPKKFVFSFESYVSTHPRVVLNKIGRSLEPPSTVKMDLADGVLSISGSAPHSWVLKMREGLKGVPGVSSIRDVDLVDADVNAFNLLRLRVEQRYVLFEFRSEDLVAGQDPELRAWAEDLKNLLGLAKILDRTVRAEIVGHADSLGTEPANLAVSLGRARKILSVFVQEGLDAAIFATLGLGSREPFREERTDQDRDLNRRVTIRIID